MQMISPVIRSHRFLNPWMMSRTFSSGVATANRPKGIPDVNRDKNRLLLYGPGPFIPYPVIEIARRSLLSIEHFSSHGKDGGKVFAVFENRLACMTWNRAVKFNSFTADHPGQHGSRLSNPLDHPSTHRPVDGTPFATAGPSASLVVSTERLPAMSGLMGKYTFDTFVIGQSNRFAHAAALAAAETPGTKYNPLFIYGGVGLGKTHLLQAIGNYALRNHPNMKVRYVTLETFTNDFINSLRDDSIEGFKNRYRSIDVLLIDDVQFLHKKEQTQEEFFHTFNALYDAGKQIAITSDRHPKGLVTLEDRLVSRFEWGLITDIQPPDLETRVAILRKKVRSDGIALADDDVLMLIASRVPTNIRELEGCLTRVVAYASVTKRALDVELARDVLKDIPETPSTRITIDGILTAVAESTGISITEIVGDKRSRSIVESRHLAMYLARELTDSSLPKIGERIGNRDHTTVLHAVDKIAKRMQQDRDTYNLVQRLTSKVKSAR